MSELDFKIRQLFQENVGYCPGNKLIDFELSKQNALNAADYR